MRSFCEPLLSNGSALDMSPKRLGWLEPAAANPPVEQLWERYRQHGYLWLGLALDGALAMLLPGATLPWQRSLLFGLGIGLLLCGVALRWYAIWTLGRSFTCDVAVSADQPVVQRGPYRSIRHPTYSGTFLTMLGVGLALGNRVGRGAGARPGDRSAIR